MEDNGNHVRKVLAASTWIHIPDEPKGKWVNGKLKLRVRCCAPHLLWGTGAGAHGVTYTCIECGSKNTKQGGWSASPVARVILDMTGPYLLASWTYACKDCGKATMRCSDPRSLRCLGFDRHLVYDFVLSHRWGMSQSMLTNLRGSIVRGMTFSGCTSLFSEVWREAYDVHRCITAGHLWRRQQAQDLDADGARSLGFDVEPTSLTTPTFPGMGDGGIDGFPWRTPSTNWLRNMFVRSVYGEKHMYETLMALHADGTTMAADDSYKVTKRAMSLRGSPLFCSLFTVVNLSNNAVVLMLLTTTKAHDALLPSLRQLNRVRQSLGYDDLEVITLDNARQDEWLWVSAFPSLARPVPCAGVGRQDPVHNKLLIPPECLRHVTVSSVPSVINAWCCAGMGSDVDRVSIDTEHPTETRWNGGPGRKSGKVSVISIAYMAAVDVDSPRHSTVDDVFPFVRTLVAQVSRMSKLSDELIHLLTSRQVMKCGKAVKSHDARHLHMDWGVCLRPTCDLAQLAKECDDYGPTDGSRPHPTVRFICHDCQSISFVS